MRRRGKIDPLARQVLLEIAAGRTAIGVAAATAPGLALRALGFPADGGGQTLARIGGCRDIALGALTLAAGGDRARLRAAGTAAAAVDAGDAVAFALAARDPGLRRGGIGSSLAGAGAAAIGAWALRRLGGR